MAVLRASAKSKSKPDGLCVGLTSSARIQECSALVTVIADAVSINGSICVLAADSMGLPVVLRLPSKTKANKGSIKVCSRLLCLHDVLREQSSSVTQMAT